jgi:hypothetical protein
MSLERKSWRWTALVIHQFGDSARDELQIIIELG